MTKKLENTETEYKNLRIFNLVMGFFHLIQAILLFALSNDFRISLTTTFLKSSGATPENFTIYPETKEFLTVAVGPAVALFLLISAIAHFLLASPIVYEWYVQNLKKHINYARWWEYALSSSIMIVLIAGLSGFFDAPGLLLLFTLNAMMNLFGLVMEKMNQDKKKVDWTAFIYGCVAGIVPWIVIAWYFVSAIKGYQPGEDGNPVPDFVYAILISIFIFFNIFAINMYLQYKQVGPWKNYLFGEKMYIVLSLVAKSALAWQVFSGTLRGNS